MNNPNQNYEQNHNLNGPLQENDPSRHIAQMSIYTTESVIRFACNRISRGE
jgi:hypothetical protein